MKNSQKLALILLLIILCTSSLFLSGCWFNQDKQLIEATGTVEMTDITISSQIGGKVLEIWAEEGQPVKKGQLLIEIDHEQLDAQISAAKASLGAIKANLDSARLDLGRIRQLYEQQLVSESQYDQAVTRVEVNQAQLEQGQSNLNLLETQLKNVKVFAPESGILSEKLINEGEIVAPGMALFTTLDVAKPWVKIYLSEVTVQQVFLNQEAYVVMDAYPKEKIPGRISFISQEAEFTPKNYQTKEERVKQVYAVKISLDNSKSLLKAGMPVDVWVKIGK